VERPLTALVCAAPWRPRGAAHGPRRERVQLRPLTPPARRTTAPRARSPRARRRAVW